MLRHTAKCAANEESCLQTASGCASWRSVSRPICLHKSRGQNTGRRFGASTVQQRTVMQAKKACSSSAHSEYFALRFRSRVLTLSCCVPPLFPMS